MKMKKKHYFFHQDLESTTRTDQNINHLNSLEKSIVTSTFTSPFSLNHSLNKAPAEYFNFNSYSHSDSHQQNNTSFKIYLQNCQGMRAHLEYFKLSILENDYDIIGITETFLYPDILSSEFIDQTHYKVFRKDRCRNKAEVGGGILLAIKSNLICSLNNLIHNEVEQIISTVKSENNNLIISLSYIVPNSHEIVYQQHLENIRNIFDSANNDSIIVFGDFNLSNVNWKFMQEEQTLMPFNVTKKSERTLIDSLFEMDMKQINDIPNFHGRFLDLVFISHDFSSTIFEADQLINCKDLHHKPVFFNLISYSFDKFSSLNNNSYKLNFHKANFDLINEFLGSINWDETLLMHNSLETNYNKFLDIINQSISNFVPTKKLNNNVHPPWWSKGLKRLKNAKNKAHKKSTFSPEARAKFEQLRREFQFLHRFLHKQYIYSVENDIKSNSKKFWVYINELKNKSEYPNEFIHNEKTSYNLQDSVNLFASYFSSTFSSDDTNIIPDFSDISPIVDIGSIDIEEADLLAAINELDNNTSYDTDNVCNLFLKKCSSKLLYPLRVLFNISLTEGHFIKAWKLSSVKPTFKSGLKNLVKNYRPISKQNCVPKLLDKIVTSKIYTLVENKLSDFQHGFVKGRSITTNLVSYTNFIASALEEGHVVHSIYTDFSKAFDKVIIRFLISKLKALGFHSSLLKWLSSFLSDRYQFVKIGQFKSILFSVLSGLPQGSHLGPLLFILMINDLPSVFVFAFCLLYADDLKLYSKISSLEHCNSLQNDLTSLLIWCHENGFKLNFEKCYHMIFVKGQKKFNFVYKLDNYQLKTVDEILDLGVYLVADFTFNRHFNYICAKAACWVS